MLKILVLLFFASVSAKLDKPSYDYILFEVFNTLDESPSYKKASPAPIVWVLSLNRDVETLKLRAASGKEIREVFGKQDDAYSPNYRQPRTGKDPKQELSTTSPQAQKTVKVDGKSLLAEIMRVINKFALTTHTEPDVYLENDSDKTPTMQLYFKGAHTSLVVRAEGKQWHYIIGPSTLFPAWFYGEHSVERDERGPFVAVPEDVAGDFYAALLHLLTMFLSFPV